MATHRGVDPAQLTGEAERQFDVFRRMHETFGSPRDQAERFAINDLLEAGVIRLSPFDQLVDSFRQPGRTEAEARRMAVGRHGSESEARRAWDGPSDAGSLTETTTSLPPVRPAAAEVIRQEALRYLSEAKEPGASVERRDWLRATAERLARIADEVESGTPPGGAVKPTESRRSTGQRSRQVTLHELRPPRGGSHG